MSTQFSFKHSVIFIIVLFIICYSIYYDLSTGTLPKAEEPTTNETSSENYPNIVVEEEPFPAQEVVVQNGYTVLSIVEHLHEGPVPASIQQIVYDFQELNPGVAADNIQVGKTYLFPLYAKSE
ncbi:hypothetical protein [Alkalihalobacterium chitinilyticum]|uniref:LysM domain-containing protein n=1 Tax=Alkalihalobacterium chitinilyticum TaxID=2980103 RepID=A0ABT5VEP2_9BACI|nr:hypothetical protein [Alkalihalobacterium chitinilyticum]MDE5413935.1 hypothetical protein [Alkalihalobacterium chitinilyticum]